MESRKARHQHEIKAAESLDAAQSTLNNPTPGKKRKKGRGRRNRVIAFILLIIVLIGLVFGVKNLLTDKNAALNPKDTTFKRVQIAAGSTPAQMGQILEDKKVIKSSKYFYKYAMSQGAEKLKAGTYQLSPSQTIPLIFEQMASGPSAAPKLSKGYVFVAVGESADQVARNIAGQAKDVSAQAITSEFDNKALISEMHKKYPDLLLGVEKSNTKSGKLLDYVYPQAFDVHKAKTAKEVISILLESSNNTMQPYYSTLKANGLPTPNVMALLATSGKSEFERRLAFVKKIAPYAQELSKKYGLLASVSIAQAAHESNWDNSKLSSKYNNFYGVKTQDETPGKSVVLDTTEYVDGKPETQKARFAIYDSWKDSMREHAETIVNGNTWNPDQFKDVIAAKNYKQAAEALYDNHYATDVNYTKLLINVIETWNMQRYDK
ncbi:MULTISPECIES: glycoside hydrolase family 73 protein [Leuconostoc]|uniref:N-acetylmuramidase n=2 Tax=Leuconostoc kimchii TaxID=136609 RepID=D5T2P9_LEUKI|nr:MULTISPECIES: endolytic transglycosylase MltG [Leuconostoc]ADG40548.1 N-acetylmuramidase [Leuconostoc kimchii IMSNU 11154]AEJ31528.1 N-acetylmuramidase [Leuconostoc sp. C2]QBR47013.1 aminodeoxychorismate lyase [Leuconostoc kimchii]